jgi:hypothetical protein
MQQSELPCLLAIRTTNQPSMALLVLEGMAQDQQENRFHIQILTLRSFQMVRQYPHKDDQFVPCDSREFQEIFIK